MDTKIGKLFNSVGIFFFGGDDIPWCDSNSVDGCEREVADAETSSSEKHKNECYMRLYRALVHSKWPDDVQRGIAMIEASLAGSDTQLEITQKKLYLLAVGYYRIADYTRSWHLVHFCLKRAPDSRQVLTLKKAIKDKIRKDVVIKSGIAATAGLVVVIAVGIYARKKWRMQCLC